MHTSSLMSQEFSSKEACEAVAQWVREKRADQSPLVAYGGQVKCFKK